MRRVEKKPGLNKKQRKARLRFCRRYGAWTEADWLRVLFSDESTFRVLPIEPVGHWVRYRRRSSTDRYKVQIFLIPEGGRGFLKGFPKIGFVKFYLVEAYWIPVKGPRGSLCVGSLFWHGRNNQPLHPAKVIN